MIGHIVIPDTVAFSAAGCFVFFENNLLIIQRQIGKSYAKHWAIPTGKLEEGETPVDCIVRELREELGLIVNPGDVSFVSENHVDPGSGAFAFYSFALDLPERPHLTVKPDEVRSVEWVHLTTVRKRRVVPYFFNTLNDTLEWFFRNSLQLRLLPEAEVHRVKRIKPRTEGEWRVRASHSN